MPRSKGVADAPPARRAAARSLLDNGATCPAVAGTYVMPEPIGTGVFRPADLGGVPYTCADLVPNYPTTETGCLQNDPSSTCEWYALCTGSGDADDCCNQADDFVTAIVPEKNMRQRCGCKPTAGEDPNSPDGEDLHYCDGFPITIGLDFTEQGGNGVAGVVQAIYMCTKSAWEEAFRADCCFGWKSGDMYCSQTWCPYDVAGGCTDLFLASCSGASACGRHKFLVADSVSTDNIPCNLWYLSVRDQAFEYAANGSLSVDDGGELTSTSEDTPVPRGLIDAVVGINEEIARYCGAEGSVSGECACYNAYTACAADAQTGQECFLAVPIHGSRAQRVDAYCDVTDAGNAANNASYTSDGTSGSISLCDDSGYDRQVMNRMHGEPQSFDDADLPSAQGVFGGMPTHCWYPACQGSDDTLAFRNFIDELRPCPSVCFALSGGASINIDYASGQWAQIADESLLCDFGEGQNRELLATPYAVPPDCTSLEVALAPNQIATIPLSFTSLNQDNHTSFSSLSIALYSSLGPLMSFSPAVGEIPNLGSFETTMTINTCGVGEYSAWQGFIAVQDPSPADNGPSYVPIALNVLDAGATPSLPTACSPAATVVDATPSQCAAWLAGERGLRGGSRGGRARPQASPSRTPAPRAPASSTKAIAASVIFAVLAAACIAAAVRIASSRARAGRP